MDIKNKIKTAIKQFPTIEEVIGIDRIIKEIKKNKNMPVIQYLCESLYNKYEVHKLYNKLLNEPNNYKIILSLNWILESFNIMKHLDNILFDVKNENKLKTSINLLLTSFYDGYSEIEIASFFKKIFGEIELQPKIPNNKYADISYFLNSEKFFVEIKTPIWGQKYEDILSKMSGEYKSKKIPIAFKAPDFFNRIYSIILEAIKKFENCLDKINSIIIIDITNSDFKEMDIQIYLNDSIDSLYEHDERLKKIGSIICYKRDYQYNGKVIYKKQFFSNPYINNKYKILQNIFT